MAEAIAHYRTYGESLLRTFYALQIDHADFERFIVESRDPLGFEPGSAESRFVDYVLREGGGAP
jgi:hypothetical protein